MKKLIALLAVLILTAGSMAARDKIYRDASPLPAAAKTMLKTYFPKNTVNQVKVDKNLLGGADYEVILNDGTEIEFNKDGEWQDIDCGHRSVPSKLILAPIRNYVAKNYKGAGIVKIDKDRNDYEIELTNGIELKFDRAGKFLRIDD